MKYIDRWCVAHLLGWALIGTWVCWALNGPAWSTMAMVIFYGTWIWELVEMARERWLRSTPEHWVNRAIVDPVCNVAGGMSGWAIATAVLF